jgi:tetratricopeptide (TPR) repeat protein
MFAMQRRKLSWILVLILLGDLGSAARAQEAATPPAAVPDTAEPSGQDPWTAASQTPDAATLRQRAWERFEAGQADQALDLLTEAIARFPDDASNYWLRSEILSDLKRYDAAIADLRRITELKPEFADAWGNLGWHLILQGDFAAAQASQSAGGGLGAGQLRLESQPWPRLSVTGRSRNRARLV